MKKVRRQYGKIIAVWILIIFVIFLFLGWINPNRLRESVDTAARVIVGEGMLKLVQDALDPPLVALTFDDGPSKKYTAELLDGLKKRNVKASFFLLGKSLEGNEALVKRMYRDGHLIGNHTFHHVQLDRIPEKQAKEEILRTNNRIYEITGKYPVYMRPPYGAWNEEMELQVEMIPVFWNIDTLDWKTQNVDSIIQIVRENVKNGSILLMHDEYAATVEAALKIVDELTEEGCRFVTVDRLILP